MISARPPLSLDLAAAASSNPSRYRLRNVANMTQRDENGKPFILESVQKAEDILHQQRKDKEYLPITVRSSSCKRHQWSRPRGRQRQRGLVPGNTWRSAKSC